MRGRGWNHTFTGNNGSGQGGGFLVTGDEFDVLDSAAVGDGDCADDGARFEVPETESVCSLDTGGWLEDGERDDEIRSKHDIIGEIDGQSVRRELLLENVQGACDVFGPFVDDVEVCVGFDESTGSG